MIDKNDGFGVEPASLLSETQIRGLHDDRRLCWAGRDAHKYGMKGVVLRMGGARQLFSMRNWIVDVDSNSHQNLTVPY